MRVNTTQILRSDLQKAQTCFMNLYNSTNTSVFVRNMIVVLCLCLHDCLLVIPNILNNGLNFEITHEYKISFFKYWVCLFFRCIFVHRPRVPAAAWSLRWKLLFYSCLAYLGFIPIYINIHFPYLEMCIALCNTSWPDLNNLNMNLNIFLLENRIYKNETLVFIEVLNMLLDNIIIKTFQICYESSFGCVHTYCRIASEIHDFMGKGTQHVYVYIHNFTWWNSSIFKLFKKNMR